MTIKKVKFASDSCESGWIYLENSHPVKELTISNNEIHKEFLKLIENCDSKLSIGDVGFPDLIEDFARAILKRAFELTNDMGKTQNG